MIKSIAKKFFAYRFYVIKNKAIDVKSIIFILLTVAVLVVLLISPSVYIQSTVNGLNIFALSVLPSLFPFMFFSTVLTNLGTPLFLSKLSFTKKLYNAPPISSYVLFMSLLCGYPVGAKILDDLYMKGYIDSSDVKKCASFTSTSGPLFILGTMGSAILNDIRLSVFVLLAHYLSAFLNGFIYRGKTKKEYKSVNLTLNVKDALDDSIKSSTVTMLNLCGYIVVFNLIIDVLLNLNVIGFIENLSHSSGIVEALLCGMVEMTRGTIMVSKLTLPAFVKCGMLSFIISFSGLGIIFQTLSFVGECGVRKSAVILEKFTQSIIAAILGVLLGLMY